ncbi:MAG TPA: hypothetical protein VGI40_21260 [Pirellulaceae bacterium]|jgi:uncharacterized delta-60 repeat protein
MKISSARSFAVVALLAVVLSEVQIRAAEPAVSIELDPTFGKGGRVASLWDPKASVGALGRYLDIDDKNRPVLVGNTPKQRFAVSRFTTEGEFDTSFAGKGRTSICIEDTQTLEAAGNAELQFTHGAAIDSKGRIVLIGKGAGIDAERRWDFALLRYLPTGQLDKTFSKVGYQKFQAHDSWNIGLAVAIAPDCSTLVAAGYAQVENSEKMDPLLIRFQEDGTVDEAFSSAANGSLRWLLKEDTPAIASCVAIDRQGRYRVGMSAVLNSRSSWTLARLKNDGEIDETFGDHGLWTAKLIPGDDVEAVFSVALDDKDRLVLGGYSYDHNGFRCLAVARITDRGQSDTTFGADNTGHVVLTDYGSTVTHRYGPRAAVGKDRIAICGCVTGPNNKGTCFGVAILDETGRHIAKVEPQPFPGSNGTDQPWGIAFDRENRLLVGGGSMTNGNRWRLALARYIVK